MECLTTGEQPTSTIQVPVTPVLTEHCGGHINPALGYHVHGTAGCSDIEVALDGDIAPFAIAIDGHTIYGPLEDSESAGLDECGGHTSDELGFTTTPTHWRRTPR